MLLGEVPIVLRRELYAIPALLGAGVVVAAHQTGNLSPVFPLLGVLLCFGVRMISVRYDVDAPIAPSERGKGERLERWAGPNALRQATPCARS